MLYLNTNKKINSADSIDKAIDFLCEVTAGQWELYENLEYDIFWTVKNNTFVEKVPLQEINRLNEINNELDLIDRNYYIESQKPIIFEGKVYKFEWSELYQALLTQDDDKFPLKIMQL